MNDPQTALDVAARFLTRTLAAGGPAGARVVMAAADENAVADLIEVTLPCLLDGTNLTAWDRLGWRLLVPAAQAGRLRAAPAFTRLAERAAGETLEFTKPFPAGWLDAVSLAPSWRDGDTVIWLPAGTVLSDGALPALLNTPADTAALACPRPRVRHDAAALLAERPAPPPRRLVALLLEHAHRDTAGEFLDAPDFAARPAALLARADGGVLATCLRPHPLLLRTQALPWEPDAYADGTWPALLRPEIIALAAPERLMMLDFGRRADGARSGQPFRADTLADRPAAWPHLVLRTGDGGLTASWQAAQAALTAACAAIDEAATCRRLLAELGQADPVAAEQRLRAALAERPMRPSLATRLLHAAAGQSPQAALAVYRDFGAALPPEELITVAVNAVRAGRLDLMFRLLHDAWLRQPATEPLVTMVLERVVPLLPSPVLPGWLRLPLSALAALPPLAGGVTGELLRRLAAGAADPDGAAAPEATWPGGLRAQGELTMATELAAAERPRAAAAAQLAAARMWPADRVRRRRGRRDRIVLMSPRVSPRELKMARAAGLAGFETVLVHGRATHVTDQQIAAACHAHLACEDTEAMLSAAVALEPLVHHVFATSENFELCARAICADIGPVVADFYDSTVMYRIPEWREPHRSLEAFCIERADGICARHFMLQAQKREHGIRPRGPLLFFPEYAWDDGPIPAKPSDRDGILRVVHGGLQGFEEEDGLAEIAERLGFQYHIYPHYHGDPAAFETAFAEPLARLAGWRNTAIHRPVYGADFLAEMGRYDVSISWVNRERLDKMYRPPNFRYLLPNKVADALDAELLFVPACRDGLLPPIVRRLGLLPDRFADSDIHDERFWHGMLDECRRRRPAFPALRRRWSLAAHAPRLGAFYRRVAARR